MRNTWRLVGLVGAVVLAGCSSAARHSLLPATTLGPVTTATTQAPATTTTVYHATTPQASADTAGSHLLAAWRTADRAGALAAATPAAVDAVFARPYPAGGVQPRGCAPAAAGPWSCAYRVDTGLLTLDAVPAGGGWIVQSGVFES